MRGSLLSQKQFISEGIKKLVQRWKKCIEKQGDYVEKWCYCKFSIFIEIKFVSVVRIIIDSPTCIQVILRNCVECLSILRGKLTNKYSPTVGNVVVTSYSDSIIRR